MGLLDIIAGPIFHIIDKVLPDPAAKATAQLEMLKLQQSQEGKQMEAALQSQLAQVEVNKIEASSKSLFVSGWRPSVGWVSTAGLAYQFLLHPMLCWVSGIKGFPSPPRLDMDTLMALLGGMLGLSGMRTTEKLNGVASK